MKECIFCKIAREEIASDKIYENDNFFSIFDHAPHTKGHALIISKKHFKNVLDMSNTLGAEFLEAIKKTFLKLTEKYEAEGFNVVINTNKVAGQEVEHFHAHILPRKEGDGFKIFVKKD